MQSLEPRPSRMVSVRSLGRLEEPRLSSVIPGPSRPLCERRPKGLVIKPRSYRWWSKMHICDDMFLEFEDSDEPKESEAVPRDPQLRLPPPYLVQKYHLVRILDGLYIALANDKGDIPALRTFDDERFTHIVQLCYGTSTSKRRRRRSAKFSPRGREAPRHAPVQQLELNRYERSRYYPRTNQTVLGPKELRAARDFLSLALPYGSDAWWPEEECLVAPRGEECGYHAEDHRDEEEEDDDDDDKGAGVHGPAQFVTLANTAWLDALLGIVYNTDEDEPEDVNLLIVAPMRRAVDVLAVLFCYLAFLEDAPVREVSDMDYFDDVWQGVSLAPRAVQYVERIAKSKCE